MPIRLSAMVVFSVIALASQPATADDPSSKAKALIDAAHRGDVDAVDAALKAGVDVNATVDDKWSALHAAAERSRVDVIKRLIKSGANAKAKNHLDVTPLHWAAIRGPREAVKALIDAGADVNVECVQYDTPLGAAAGAGNIETSQELITAGADVNGGKWMTPLTLATRRSQVPMIRLLIKHGARVNDPKNPALLWVSKPEAAKALLDAGADLNIRDAKGQTALHLPHGHWVPNAETAKVLIDAKADVNANSMDGSTPLHAAIRHRDIGIVNHLLRAGANLDAKDKQGNTPLSLAKQAGESFTAALTAAGAKSDGRTDLLRAVDAGDLNRVKSLIRDRADVNETGPGRSSAVHLASKSGHGEILTELIHAGAKVDERDESGLRPLHYAANAAVADELIKAGAKVNESNGRRASASPLNHAALEGRADVVKVLIAHKADVTSGEAPGPLIGATFAGRDRVVEVLLDAGVTANEETAVKHESALHVAAGGGFADMGCPEHVTAEIRLKIAKLLIEKGADVNAKADVGYFVDSTPLHAAAGSGHLEILKLLLDKGAAVDAASPRGLSAGYTAIHKAAEHGHEAAVQLLIERKADVNALTSKENFRGVRTPLDLAKDQKVRALLIKHGAKSGEELAPKKP